MVNESESECMAGATVPCSASISLTCVVVFVHVVSWTSSVTPVEKATSKREAYSNKPNLSKIELAN